jgi:hypothetical protein
VPVTTAVGDCCDCPGSGGGDDGFGPTDCCDGDIPQVLYATLTADCAELDGRLFTLVRTSNNNWVSVRQVVCTGSGVSCEFFVGLSCTGTGTSFSGGLNTSGCVPVFGATTPVTKSCSPFLYEFTQDIDGWEPAIPGLRADCGFTCTYTLTITE